MSPSRLCHLLKELYAEDAWSIEPEHAPTPPIQGMAAFAEKENDEMK
ncbi:MAG: hypothetical protein ACJAT4_000391 [Granulosicoccus sp.]